MYCEAAGSLHPINSSAYRAANATALEFWMKIALTSNNFLSVSDDASHLEIKKIFSLVLTLLKSFKQHLLTVLGELKECRSIIVDKASLKSSLISATYTRTVI